MDSRQLKYANHCPFIVKMIALILIATGLIVLIGWKYHSIYLTSISPSWLSTKINTAICFILSGFTLFFSNSDKRGMLDRTIIILLSSCILLVASLTLIEFIFGYDFHIDQLLTKDSLGLATQYPGRMTFITTIILVFVACAFLFNNLRTKWLSHFFGLMIFYFSLLSITNYIFIADMSYFLTEHTAMALPTTLLFILLSFGIFLLKPYYGITEIALKKSSAGYYLRHMLPLVFVPLLMAVIENKFENLGLIDVNFGDSIIATGTFIVLSIIIYIIVRKIDREENKLLEAETQIQQKDMIFREFAEKIDIVFYRTTPDLSQILYVSPAYEKIWGRSIESAYQNPLQWFEAILPEDQKRTHDEYYTKLISGAASVYAEFRIKRPDGDIRNILARGFNLKDKDAKRFCVIGVAVDITELKQEKKYSHTREDILHIIENEQTLDEGAPKILQMVCQMNNWDLGEIWLIDQTKNILRFVNNWHIESEKISAYNKISLAQTFKLGEGLPGRIWQKKEPVWISDYSQRREFSRSLDAEKAGLNCAFGIPIIHQDHIFGVMLFFSYKIQTPDKAMLRHMSNIGKLMGELIHRSTTNDQIAALSRRDILTGFLNRSAIEEDLNNLINNNKFEIIAIIIVDIDKFKIVNEALGHDKSNSIIKFAAQRLAKLIDENKINAGRLDADKFILCYFEIQNAEDIKDYAHKIERTFKEPFIIDQKEIYLTASVGIAIYPQDGSDSKTLMVNADHALTSAKKDGGNKTRFFTKELSSIALDNLAMHIDLHQAITKKQFVLNYQPQIDLKTGDICGAEALVRWQHPTKGLVSPQDFISYAEEMGLIILLNEHIIRMVFQQVKSGWTGPPISVNISSLQFKDKYHLVEYIESLMAEFSVNPKHIEFEITESLFMENSQHYIGILGALQQMGFQFAIDDFGTGFSSFSYLYRLPVHKIKIDKSFITGLPENQANAKIVKSMIVMLHSLGKLIVAEGAETLAEVEYLKNEKCDIAQGYYYYKPLSSEDFIALIKR